MEFIGLKNFRDLFHDHILITALKNNIIYILIVVGMQIVLGFVTAVLLSYVKKVLRFYPDRILYSFNDECNSGGSIV